MSELLSYTQLVQLRNDVQSQYGKKQMNQITNKLRFKLESPPLPVRDVTREGSNSYLLNDAEVITSILRKNCGQNMQGYQLSSQIVHIRLCSENTNSN